MDIIELILSTILLLQFCPKKIHQELAFNILNLSTANSVTKFYSRVKKQETLKRIYRFVVSENRYNSIVRKNSVIFLEAGGGPL